jgi:hypothetical protein
LLDDRPDKGQFIKIEAPPHKGSLKQAASARVQGQVSLNRHGLSVGKQLGYLWDYWSAIRREADIHQM